LLSIKIQLKHNIIEKVKGKSVVIIIQNLYSSSLGFDFKCLLKPLVLTHGWVCGVLVMDEGMVQLLDLEEGKFHL
jgi:hypothetical protein